MPAFSKSSSDTGCIPNDLECGLIEVLFSKTLQEKPS